MGKNEFAKLLKNSFVFFDGGLGTQLQEKGLGIGEAPEIFLMRSPHVLQEVHQSYRDAGAQVMTACTFGANRLKLANYPFTVREVFEKALSTAKAVAGDDLYTAVDIGPLGEMLKPMGTLSFEEAYDLFKEQMILGEKYGADIILIETMTDLAEAKIALLAAKENTSLPVICTMSFEENQRTFMGCSVESMALTLSPLADAIGINCSLGPEEILPIVKTLIGYTNLPVVVQPNAGLPRSENGKTVFDVDDKSFAKAMKSFARLGVTGLGGCCGTTPEHIFEMRNQLDVTPQKRKKVNICAVCSPSKVLEIGGCHVIGERINPTGKKAFQAALKNNDIDYILNQGIEQADAGADILDVNVGLPDIDEVNVSKKVICELQAILDLPLQIDSSNPLVIEESLRAYTGKAIVNSVNGEQKVLDSILPLVKKYGAMAVALTLDENGIPKSAADRFNIAEKIINEAAKYGIEKENIIVDCLTLTVSAQQEDAAETLKALKMVKEKLGVKTVLGVSNISFGLPRRDIINEVFLAQALACGLDLAIINPNAGGMMKAVFAHRVLANIDKGAAAYIDKFALNPAESNMAEVTNLNLADIIMKGLKDKAKDATRLLQREKTELEIVNDYIIPALDRVGERYDKGIIFLPQLISSAETVKNSFEVLKESLLNQGGEINKGTIILATVKGDIHDIGKNIVKVILENYGYRIVDLGRDVPIETVVAETLKHKAKLVGLSALMTTTVKSMADTIKALKDTCPDTKVFVGGAVLTGEYAKQIGADYYGKDAKQAVEIAKRVLG